MRYCSQTWKIQIFYSIFPPHLVESFNKSWTVFFLWNFNCSRTKKPFFFFRLERKTDRNNDNGTISFSLQIFISSWWKNKNLWEKVLLYMSTNGWIVNAQTYKKAFLCDWRLVVSFINYFWRFWSGENFKKSKIKR
jgi:hypothetical protein